MHHQGWKHWLDRLYTLNRDKSGGHERPHKPALLLSIIDLIDRGLIQKNAVPLSEELTAAFKRVFAVVRQHDDRPTIQNPFFHLCGEGFWELVPARGESPLYVQGEASGSPSLGKLKARIAFGRFDEGLWRLLRDPDSRHRLQQGLVARYFPERRLELAKLVPTHLDVHGSAALNDEWPPGRDAAFRRLILELYDYRCAACGIRIKITEDLCLAQAAHLIPFTESRNDNPTNGLALCPNHHWAMDRHLIAPCPDPRRMSPAGIWQVNTRSLDDRTEGGRELTGLAGRTVIEPNDRRFFPAHAGLRWREEHLHAKY